MIVLGFLTASLSGNIWMLFVGGVIGAILLGYSGHVSRSDLLKDGLVSGLVAGLLFSAVLMLNANTISLKVFLIVLVGMVLAGVVGGFISSIIWKNEDEE